MIHKARAATVYFPALVLALAVCFGAPSQAAEETLQAQIYLDQLGEETEGDEAIDLDQLDEPTDDEAAPGQDLRPDVKGGDEETEPPQSAQETKQNKLGLGLAKPPLITPLERPKMLAHLYEQLGNAKDEEAADPIIKAIEELWVRSGSDTVDLLMARADRFVKESDLDLALEILDATADLAPEDAEVWHQRAKVYFLREDYERALADLRRTLSLDPKHYKAINDLGVVLEELGAKKEALEAYRKALEINPFLDRTREAVESLKREVEGQDI